MNLDEAIRRRGFRRWYERQLYEGFAWLVTGLLALIMMGLALEVIGFGDSLSGMVALLAVGAAGGAICVFAWRRFTAMLGFAEYMAEQAVCPACRVYARLELERSGCASDTVSGCRIHVRCRACDHRWTIG